MEFDVYNSVGQKIPLSITNVQKEVDIARFDAEYMGMKLKDTLLCFGAGHRRPFIRFVNSDKRFVDVELTNEIIEYLWKEIGCPISSIFYSYTEDYKRNWCD